eukprot:2677076-Rhodomonas_salina.2
MNSVLVPVRCPAEIAELMVDAEPGADLHSIVLWDSQVDISHAVPILSAALFCQVPRAFPATVKTPEPVDGTFADEPFLPPTITPTGPSKDTLCVLDSTSNPAVVTSWLVCPNPDEMLASKSPKLEPVTETDTLPVLTVFALGKPPTVTRSKDHAWVSDATAIPPVMEIFAVPCPAALMQFSTDSEAQVVASQAVAPDRAEALFPAPAKYAGATTTWRGPCVTRHPTRCLTQKHGRGQPHAAFTRSTGCGATTERESKLAEVLARDRHYTTSRCQCVSPTHP